ncbi:MAG: hypothetical protein KGN77_07035 [Xanthomonadaceae bacterium]|nr:hypothetical protein [Xanthomonadaceae bacterium]MDE1964301.1 hypothetical protein [Xanthomonadaceae bacterium]
MRLILAFVAAALAPVGAITLLYLYDQFTKLDAGDPYIWVHTRGFALLCLTVSTVSVLVLGIPAYLALRGRSAMRWWGAWLAGFLLTAVPFGLLTFPDLASNPGEFMEAGGVKLAVNGVPTLAGWTHYLEGVVFLGACGALAAAVFWMVSGMGKKGSAKDSAQSDVTR